MKYLLDSNSVIDHLRHGASSNVTSAISSAPPNSVHLCSVVVAELLFGVWRSPLARQTANLALVANLQRRFPSIPFDDSAAEAYARIRADLAAAGKSIGPNDLMIAAIALANQMTLVTHNSSEFSRVQGLMIEDWQ